MIIDINNSNLSSYIDKVREINHNSVKYICVITFGCQQNEADSEVIRGIGKEMGYLVTDDPAVSDLIIINTCAIREHAEKKALSVLGNMKKYKTSNPDLIVGIMGCMAEEEHVVTKIKKSFPYVSFTLEPSAIYRLPETLYGVMQSRKREFIYNTENIDIYEGVLPVRKSDFKAWVSIMYGCNNFCTYCIVPYVRGRERSRSSADVIADVERLVRDGYKEITLLGQNVNSYKSDTDFAGLLEKIALVKGDFIVRFMTSHPKDVSDRLIDVMGKYVPKIAPQFHLPLQSGSDRILKAMNRTYTAEKYLATVEKLRSAVPDIAISSDIIVGFPGESEEDFSDTMKMLKTVEFDMAYTFIYSPRKGTKAAQMDCQIPDDIKGRRLRELLELQNNISKEKNIPLINTVQKVLVDGFEEKDGKIICKARTLSNKLVHFEGEKNFVGKFELVKITDVRPHNMIGEKFERN